MAKNRKRRDNAFHLRQTGIIVLLLGAIVLAALAYIREHNQSYRLGRDIKQSEVALEEAKRRNMLFAAQTAQLKSPAALQERIVTLNINLVPPKDNQIIRLPAPTRGAPPAIVTATPPAPPAVSHSRTPTARSRAVYRRP